MTQPGAISRSLLHSRGLSAGSCPARDKRCTVGSCYTLDTWGGGAPHRCAALALLRSGHRHADGAAVNDVTRHLCQRPVALRFIAEAHKAIALGAPCEGICDHLHSGICQSSKAWALQGISEALPQAKMTSSLSMASSGVILVTDILSAIPHERC